MGDDELEHLDFLPTRIQGFQRLEALFNQEGYLICQATGNKIYAVEDVVALFIPLCGSKDQVIAVHRDHAKTFMQKCLLALH